MRKKPTSAQFITTLELARALNLSERRIRQLADEKYLEELVDKVLTGPHIESAESMFDSPSRIFFRLKETATASEPGAFITDREFVRILLGAFNLLGVALSMRSPGYCPPVLWPGPGGKL